jgi:phage terminase small subunit
MEKRMQGWRVEFGMTPSSRSRVAVAEGEKEKDPFAEYDGKLTVHEGGKK